jgi:hypothetical protein
MQARVFACVCNFSLTLHFVLLCGSRVTSQMPGALESVAPTDSPTVCGCAKHPAAAHASSNNVLAGMARVSFCFC